MKRIYILLLAAFLLPQAIRADKGGEIKTANVDFHLSGGAFHVSLDFVLDELLLKSNEQMFVTPVISGPGGAEVAMPSILISGRNMHYAYERGAINIKNIESYDVTEEVRRLNGQAQNVSYTEKTAMRSWMRHDQAALHFVYDTCGCGRPYGKAIGEPIPLNLNPAPRMRVAYITPPVTPLPVSVHEGRARVQFEVDKVELHDQPYVCRNGQRIDNREQLKTIEDSVHYALSNPDVEIASIAICGYASPESPYTHNDYLATNRSRALAEYIGKRFSLPAEKCTYSSVPENWAEFRQQVTEAKDITEQQRSDLLQLIDRPTYGPADFDAKERELKTDKRFAALYRSKILPVWFPQLRCTKFAISTRLKPMSDEKLAEIIEKTPELMSLNQMFRVARLYPEGSERFNATIETALRYYPDSPIANTNAAVAAIKRGDYAQAQSLLKKAGNAPEAENARGVIATNAGNYEEAVRHFTAAGNLPEAAKNKEMIAEE